MCLTFPTAPARVQHSDSQTARLSSTPWTAALTSPTSPPLLHADTNFKLSVYNPDAQALEAVYLGPTFGGPISQLLTFRSTSSTCNFLAYATSERVVGLIAWPLAGDPAQTMGLIAHPGDVQSLAISYDGRKLLTAGGQDRKGGCMIRFEMGCSMFGLL